LKKKLILKNQKNREVTKKEGIWLV
jgi:hypothetical protein